MLLVLCFLALASPPTLTMAEEGNVVMTAEADPEIRAAQAEARAKLDVFITALDQPPPGAANFAVKRAFEDGDEVEHMWVSQLEWDGTQFAGKLDNDPAVVTTVSAGDEVRITRDQVEDWLFMEGRRMVGGFTVNVLMVRERERAAKHVYSH